MPGGKEKNKEHVIPRWLSKLSQRDESPASIFHDGSVKRIPFKDVVLPACAKCNSDWGTIESEVRTIFLRMFDGKIRTNDIPILMKWLDKTRLLIWLRHRAGNRSRFVFPPTFSVDERSGRHDSVICLALLPESFGKGIDIAADSFGEYPNNTFVYMPSCFGMIVRNLAILNFSSPMICDYLRGFVDFRAVTQDDLPLDAVRGAPESFVYLTSRKTSDARLALPRLTTIDSLTVILPRSEGAKLTKEILDQEFKPIPEPSELQIPRYERINLNFAYFSWTSDVLWSQWNIAQAYPISDSRNQRDPRGLEMTKWLANQYRFLASQSNFFTLQPLKPWRE